LWAPLAVGRYRWFLTGTTFAGLGLWMLRLVQSLLALRLSDGSAAVAGITVMLQFAPVVVLSALVGAVAERTNPSRVLAAGQGLMVIAAGLEAGLALTGRLTLIWSLALALAFGIGTAVDNSLRMTIVPELVPPELVGSAVSTNMLANQLSRLVGPATAGFVIAAYGYGAALSVTAVLILVCPVVLLCLRLGAPAERRASPAIWNSIADGVRYLRSRPDFKLVFIAVAIGGMLGPNLTTIVALIVTQKLALSTAQVGFANLWLAVGTLLGVVASERLALRSARAVGITTAAVAITGGALALANSLWLLCVLIVPAGAAALAMVTQSSGYVQVQVPAELRSRITALYAIALVIGAPTIAPVIGVLADAFGTGTAVALVAACVLLVSLGATFAYSRALKHAPAAP
jgi:MFS family permease